MTTAERPFSPACERNREPILAVLRNYLPSSGQLLEIGSGTGQHAHYFAPEFPGLVWQTSDVLEHHSAIEAWRAAANATNLQSPIELTIGTSNWPNQQWDIIFTANTLHIMSWPLASRLITEAASQLAAMGKLIIYGPFNYGGRYTSASNQDFDQSLKYRDPLSGIRDFEAIAEQATAAGLALLEDVEMPANNRCLVWQKTTP